MTTMATTRQARAGALAEINVTPLIDVMLVLLVVFMISLPMPQRTTSVALPQPGPDPVTASPAEPVRLAIAGDGGLSWDGVAMTPAQLAWHARRAAASPGAPPILIEPAAQARYQDVARVLVLVRNAGVERVGFQH
ncbi:MAG: biopolymer transporter ExbD [Pseudoxanthomonas sp.]|nr:biopolymer transporter ExbD [Pseudoxanthomonas sp.]